MLNKTFFVKDFLNGVEMMANTIQGLVEGIEYLVKENYEFNFNASTVIGINYFLYASKKEKTEEEVKQENEKIKELIDEIKALKDKNDTLKNQVKEKINLFGEKAKEVKELKDEVTKLKIVKTTKDKKK